MNHGKIKVGDIITIKYRIGIEGMVNSHLSKNEGAFTFRAGEFPKFNDINKAVLGMVVGEKKKITMLPKDAFGEVDKDLIFVVPLSKLPIGLQIGNKLIQDSRGLLCNVILIDQKKRVATLDANHTLAGDSIDCSFEILSLKRSSASRVYIARINK